MKQVYMLYLSTYSEEIRKYIYITNLAPMRKWNKFGWNNHNHVKLFNSIDYAYCLEYFGRYERLFGGKTFVMRLFPGHNRVATINRSQKEDK